ncbi:MAG: putative DNA-binding domain-containing protein [Bacteroidota bacterium]|nr:putative DNA-binding domain-containing protein [Bacteroidota bacterium]
MLKPDTIQIQNDLAGYCRTGKMVDIPGTSKARLPHYRRLVYNVINSTMEQAFPITREILDDEEWKTLIDRFFIEHDTQTPKLWELPYELFKYAKSAGYAEQFSKPYLTDLLYFEWVEIEVHTMRDKFHPDYTPEGDLINDPIVLNHESRLIRLRYPVHLYAASETISKPGNYYVFIFREPETGTVRFMSLSVLHVHLFEKFYLNNLIVSDFIDDIAKTFDINDYKMLEKEIIRFLQELLSQGGILGFTNKE